MRSVYQCPFSTVIFLQCISSYDVLCPGWGGAHSTVKRMGVLSENFEKTLRRYEDPVLWPRSNEYACLSHAKQASAKMVADLNFAVCVLFREDKAKTKQLRFLP